MALVVAGWSAVEWIRKRYIALVLVPMVAAGTVENDADTLAPRHRLPVSCDSITPIANELRVQINESHGVTTQTT